MKKNRYAGVLALNGALLAALALVTFLPGPGGAASAQRTAGGSSRARGEYTMVSGQVQGMSEAAIYIIDSTNQEMVAVRWDMSRKSLAPLGFRDLALDTRGGGGGR